MPKLKTHKGMKKRFKVSATGKVSHKRCGSSHLNSHKSGKRVRRLRKSTQLKVTAEGRRIRFALLEKQNVNPEDGASRRSSRRWPSTLRKPVDPARPPRPARKRPD